MGYIGAGVTRFNTADELTVTGDAQIDGNTLVVDSTNNRVGIGTTSPAQELHIVGKARVQRATNANIEIVADNNTGANPFLVGSNSDTIFVKNQAASGFGTGGDVIRYTEGGSLQLMGTNYITNGGNVGIGTSSPTHRLTVSGVNNGDHLVVTGGNIDRGLLISTFNSGRNDDGVNFDAVGTNGTLTFSTASTERMRIDSSGNLLVGKTSLAFNTEGTQIKPEDLSVTTDGDVSLYLNRLTSDGDVARFYKDGTKVGSIGTDSGDLTIDGAASHSGLRFLTTYIQPRLSGSVSNGGVDLGTTVARFKDLYLSGGAYLGGTGSANKLDDYEEGTWTIGKNSDGTGVIDLEEGFYRKIGNIVHVWGQFTVTTNFSGTTINGLPFNVANNFTVSVFGSVGIAAGSNFSAGDALVVLANENSDVLSFKLGSDASDSHSPNTTNDAYRFHISYMAA